MGTPQMKDVALVLGRSGSQEEAKLGEALGLAYLEAALQKSHQEITVSLVNAIIDPELRRARTDDFQDASIAAHRVAACDPILCGISLIHRGQRDWTAAF